ncbi:hypothetical protein SRRS_48110 [Sporomusa rhizae]
MYIKCFFCSERDSYCEESQNYPFSVWNYTNEIDYTNIYNIYILIEKDEISPNFVMIVGRLWVYTPGFAQTGVAEIDEVLYSSAFHAVYFREVLVGEA